MPSPYSAIRFRKGDGIMKNWFISITIIVLLATPVSALAAPQEPGSAPAIQGIVHIVHAQPLQKGSARVIHETGSLGTVIGPRLILTHNHFGAALGTLPNETFTISDGTGRSAVVRVADVKRIAIDRVTLLLQLPDSVNLTVLPLAERATISRLAAGDWLTVNYWDNADQRLAAKDFRLIKTANGVATLARSRSRHQSGRLWRRSLLQRSIDRQYLVVQRRCER
jgi:hypothetical protein